MNQAIFHCGVITSFIYTVIYVAKNNIIIEYEYIKNIYFQKEITRKMDYVLEKYTISFIEVFLGPAPLMSCRSTLIFIQGLFIVLKIPIVLLSGNNAYKYKWCDVVIIQNFSGNYILIERGMKNKSATLLEIEKNDYSNKKVALVAREGHNININTGYIVLLFPDIKALAILAYKKYTNNKCIKKVSEIVPFL